MPHYFEPKENAPHSYQEIEAEFEGKSFTFLTDSHVFSREAVDVGSSLLISTILAQEKDRKLRLLDLGTGIGVVGIVLATLRPAFDLVMTDVNSRALALAKKNAVGLKQNKPEIILSDGLESVNGDFDLIALNPPIRAGKDTVYRIYREAAARMTAGAALYIVIRVKQGARSTQTELERLFLQVELLERSKGYRVLRATLPK
ncbi:MAG: class I SAM-dependent methyltransferase [Clostridiaceae bacterium]|nr:class I SAM-dependent methyltransferase [Clostridiaceae bacterium]